ncbi:hypothetical protein [Brevibacillus sp. NRS-1366]|uniref:hypothetical protein n=1 Tax=Brevibacillus sp. NRS-1366 TaxID=3233899 RepID=UPI003D242CEB
MTETDTRKTIQVFEWTVKNQALMPPSFQDELQINAIGLYAQAGEWERARQQIIKARQLVAKMDSASFTLFLQAEETILALFSGQIEEAEEIIRRSAEVLQLIPMQRELGSFTVMRGICLYQRQERAKARRIVDEGVEVIRATKFIPHLIYAVNNILLFLGTFGCDEEWERKYQKIWAALSEEYRFEYLKKSILSLISRPI